MKNNLLKELPLSSIRVTKILLVMKCILAITLICTLQVSAGVFSQNIKVNLDVKNEPLNNVLNSISKQSGLVFFYSTDVLDVNQKISIKLNEVELERALEQILKDKSLGFKLIDNYIVITESQAKESKVKTLTQPQEDKRTLRGRVIFEEDGMPLPGVNVYVKGASIGAATDINGEFILDVPLNSQVLVFSIVGMATQEFIIGSKEVFEVVMKSSDVGLDELIVVGYGTQVKRNITGAIAKVEINENVSNPSHTFESVLQGQTAGVYVGQNSGRLGEAITMRIRGASSVSASNQPLYVIDGVPITTESQGSVDNQPTSPLADINYNDIESIQVLKDASAAAIYGSRASNGVVIITTKRGSSGKTKFNVNLTSGLNTPSQLREWCDAEEYLLLIDESLNNVVDENGLIWAWKTPDELKDVYIPGWRDGYNEDWQKEAFRQGYIQKVNLSASGGTDKTRFYTGLSYDNQDGIAIGNAMDKISGRINLDQTVNERLSFGMSTNLVRTQLYRIANDNAWANPAQLVAMPPVQPVIDPETGEYNTNTVYYNSLIDYRDASSTTKVFRSLLNAYIDIDIAKPLSFRSEFGTDVLNQKEKNFYGRETNWGKPLGMAEDRTVNVLNYTTNNFFTFKKDFNSLHEIDAVLGMSLQKSETEGNYLQGTGFPTDAFRNVSSASEITAYSGFGYGSSYLSYFLRSNYVLKDKYLLGISGRVDGSSRFGADNRYSFFPAFSAGWILSEENFLKEIDLLNFLKIRASYGITGNSEIGNYEALGLFAGTNYAGVSGLTPSQLRSPDLRWETTRQANFGIDYAFLNNRLSGQVDVYSKQTTDLLLYRSLPATSGYTSVTRNVGELKNWGLEFTIRSHNLSGRVKWTTDLNLAFNRNEVINIDGPEISYGVNFVIEGQEIGVFKMVEYAGVHPMTGDAIFYKNDGTNETTTNYNEAKRIIVGSPTPDFIGGLTNTILFGQFDVNLLLSFVYGNKVYLSGGRYQSSNFAYWDNQTRDQIERWQEPGDITDVPQLRFDQNNGGQHSTRYLHDGSYIRIRNLSIGYSLPKKLTDKLKMEKTRLFVTGYNLYTFTKYPGYDPEVNSLGSGSSTQAMNVMLGVDFYTTPQIRSIVFGIDINF